MLILDHEVRTTNSAGELGLLPGELEGGEFVGNVHPVRELESDCPLAAVLPRTAGASEAVTTSKVCWYLFEKYRASFAHSPARASATGEDSSPSVETSLNETAFPAMITSPQRLTALCVSCGTPLFSVEPACNDSQRLALISRPVMWWSGVDDVDLYGYH